MKNVKKYAHSRKKKSIFAHLFWPVLVLLVIVTGFFFISSYLTQNQDLRRQAVGENAQVQLSFSSSTVDDDHLKIDVLINTQAAQLAALDLQGTLSVANPGDIKIEISNRLAVDVVLDKLTAAGANTVFRVVRFASLNPSAETSTHGQFVPLFSFIITKPQNKQVTISLDSISSGVSLIGSNVTSAQYPAAQTFTLVTQSEQQGSKKTCNQNCATDTECQSQYFCYKGQCRLPDYREDSSCRGPGDQGIHRSCNEYCADNQECGSSFTCYYNRCRNPKNVTDTGCSTPPKKTTTTYGNTGSSQTSTRTTKGGNSTHSNADKIPVGAVITEIDGKPISSFTETPSPTPSLLPSPSPILFSPQPSPSPVAPSNAVAQTQTQSSNTWSSILLIVTGGLAALGALYIGYRKMSH